MKALKMSFNWGQFAEGFGDIVCLRLRWDEFMLWLLLLFIVLLL